MKLSGYVLLVSLFIGNVALCQPARADDPLVTFRSLSPEVALELAQATLANCSNRGYQVAVAVVDRMGLVQVVLRDRYAGPHTPDTSQRKAWTAVSFRSDTLSLANNTTPESPQSGARFITGALFLGGGVPVTASGSIVGGIGVSGAPSGEADHECALAGVATISTKLELGSE